MGAESEYFLSCATATCLYTQVDTGSHRGAIHRGQFTVGNSTGQFTVGNSTGGNSAGGNSPRTGMHTLWYTTDICQVLCSFILSFIGVLSWGVLSWGVLSGGFYLGGFVLGCFVCTPIKKASH